MEISKLKIWIFFKKLKKYGLNNFAKLFLSDLVSEFKDKLNLFVIPKILIIW